MKKDKTDPCDGCLKYDLNKYGECIHHYLSRCHGEQNNRPCDKCEIKLANDEWCANCIHEKKSKIAYLAAPYTVLKAHQNSFILAGSLLSNMLKNDRYNAVCNYARQLMSKSIFVFSPVIHNHPIATGDSRHILPGDWEFWKEYDLEMLKRCDYMIVLKLDGWIESVGVQAEIKQAEEWGKKVLYQDPDRPLIDLVLV